MKKYCDMFRFLDHGSFPILMTAISEGSGIAPKRAPLPSFVISEPHTFCDFRKGKSEGCNTLAYILLIEIFRSKDMTTIVQLRPLEHSDREQFVLDNQEAFNYGALEEFGLRDNHFEEDGQIISRETIEQSIDDGEAYRIVLDGKKVGGVVIKVEDEKGNLDLLFVAPSVHSKGIGYAAWCEVEKLHPEVKVWETVTPYFEQRNIHFYVNRCGFHIVEFFNKYHQDPNDPEINAEKQDEQFPNGMFRFEKVIR